MRRKGPLYLVPWRCTFACDGGCLHCASASKPPASDEVDTEGGKRIVDQIYDFGATWFGIGGGEPLLRKDLFEIVRYAKKTGLNVSIITNGYFVEGKILDDMIRNETRVSISIDGDEETNDVIRGRGAYAKAVSAMQKLSGEGLLDCLVATLANAEANVTNVNQKDLSHVVDLAKKYGARWVVFHGFIPYSGDKERLKAAPTPEQNEWAWNKIYDLRLESKGKPEINVYYPSFARVVKQRGMLNFDDWFNNFFLGRCFFGRYMSVIENGDIIPCSFDDVHRPGNIRKEKLEETWSKLQKSEFYAKLRSKNNLKGKCSVCEYRQICGGCRTTAEFYTGDIFESDPACAYIPKILREK